MIGKKPLSKTVKRFFGIGDFGFTMMSSVEIFLFVYFLTNVAQFSLPMVALITTVISITDILVAPFYGAIISAIKPFKWGRNRSWLILTPPLVIFLYMMAFTKIGPEPVAAAIVCAGAILAHTTWNLAWVANVSLVSIMGSTPDERALLASRRGTWTALAGVFFSYIGMPLALFLGKIMNNPTIGFTLVAGMMAFIMMIAYRVHFKLSEGYEPTAAELKAAGAEASKAEKIPASIMLKSVFHNQPLIILLIADVFRYMVKFIMAASAAYYFTYVAQNMALLSLFLLLISIVEVVGAYMAGVLSRTYSSRFTSIISLFGMGVFLVISKYVAYNITLFLIVVLFARFFLGVLSSSLVALYSDVVTYGEWKTGRNATSVIMGSMVMPLKVGMLSRGTLIPLVLGAAGFVAGADPSTATIVLKDAVNNIFLLIPGLFALVGGVILAVGYRLTKEKLASFQAEIDQRKAKNTKLEVVA